MSCDELRDRLNAAGPAGLNPALRSHARQCAACAAELQASEAIDAMLRMVPPAPSPAFLSRVTERVELTERARSRLAELPRISLWERWWRGVTEEPIAMVALALAPL